MAGLETSAARRRQLGAKQERRAAQDFRAERQISPARKVKILVMRPSAFGRAVDSPA
jgi:hypothetical protein